MTTTFSLTHTHYSVWANNCTISFYLSLCECVWEFDVSMMRFEKVAVWSVRSLAVQKCDEIHKIGALINSSLGTEILVTIATPSKTTTTTTWRIRCHLTTKHGMGMFVFALSANVCSPRSAYFFFQEKINNSRNWLRYIPNVCVYCVVISKEEPVEKSPDVCVYVCVGCIYFLHVDWFIIIVIIFILFVIGGRFRINYASTFTFFVYKCRFYLYCKTNKSCPFY